MGTRHFTACLRYAALARQTSALRPCSQCVKVSTLQMTRVAICQQSSRTRPRGKRSAERLRFVLQLQMDHGAQQLQAAPVGGGGAHPS